MCFFRPKGPDTCSGGHGAIRMGNFMPSSCFARSDPPHLRRSTSTPILPSHLSARGTSIRIIVLCPSPLLAAPLPAALGLLGSSCLKLPPSHTLSPSESPCCAPWKGARTSTSGLHHGAFTWLADPHRGAAHVHHACCPIPSPGPLVPERRASSGRRCSWPPRRSGEAGKVGSQASLGGESRSSIGVPGRGRNVTGPLASHVSSRSEK